MYNSELKTQRNFFTRRYSWQYFANFQIKEIDLKTYLCSLLEEFENSIRPGILIKNFKGRDRMNYINSDLEIPFENEIFSCQLSWNPSQFGMEGNHSIPCGFHLITPFDHFEKEEIFHKITTAITGESPPELSLKNIKEDPRLHIKSFRIGLDIFGMSSFASFFISAPVVLESIILEANLNQLSIRIDSEGHTSSSIQLHNQNGLISQLLNKLQLISSVDIAKDMQQKQTLKS